LAIIRLVDAAPAERRPPLHGPEILAACGTTRRTTEADENDVTIEKLFS
jgi:hypothetical protein